MFENNQLAISRYIIRVDDMNLSNDEDKDLQDFLALTAMLEEFDEVAEGRGTKKLSEDDKQLLQSLARGNCKKKDMEKATRLAASNIKAIEFLAKCLDPKPL